MCRKLFVLTSLILVLGLVSNASAALVAHYEFEVDAVTDSSGNWYTGTVAYDAQQSSAGRAAVGSGYLQLGKTYVPEVGVYAGGTGDTSQKDGVNINPTGEKGMSESAGTVALWFSLEDSHYWNYLFGIKYGATEGAKDRVQMAVGYRFRTGNTVGPAGLGAGLGNDWDLVDGSATPALSQNRWYHAALTWSATGGGNGNYQLYLAEDPIYAATVGTQLVASGTYQALNGLSYPAAMGTDGDGTGVVANYQKGIRGELDDVQIYNNVLTQAQINALPGVIPEPATIALLGLGGLVLLRKRR